MCVQKDDTCYIKDATCYMRTLNVKMEIERPYGYDVLLTMKYVQNYGLMVTWSYDNRWV